MFAYPPFFSETMIADLGNGYWRDIVEEGFKEAGLETEVVFKPLMRARGEFLAGKHPILLGSKLPPTETQDSLLIGYYQVFFNYFKSHHPNGIHFKTLTDLKPYRIGVIRGTPVASGLQKADLVLDDTSSNDSLAKKLYAKRIDIWPSTFLSARYMINKYNPEAVIDFTRNDTPFFTGTIELVYMKNDERTKEIVNQFSNGLEKMKKNGSYMRHIKKYWGKEEVPKGILLEDMR